MNDPVTCPHCREQLDIPGDLRGKPVRCANCQNIFTPPELNPTQHTQTSRTSDDPPWRQGETQPRSRVNDESQPGRQSNGGVWALLAITTFILGGCAAGCIGFGMWAYNPKMYPYTSAEGKFQVEFPADSTPAAGSGDKGNGSVTVIGQRGQTQERYVVKSYPLPAKLRTLTDTEKLNEIAKSELEIEAAGKEDQRENTTHDGHPALDVMAGTSGGLINRRNTILRCIVVGQRVYVVTAQGPNMEPQVWWVRKYFTSFTILDPKVKPQADKPGEVKEPQIQD